MIYIPQIESLQKGAAIADSYNHTDGQQHSLCPKDFLLYYLK